MTDREFEKLTQKTADAWNKYKELLDLAEAEYERRFGFHPSDRDDDYWIDCLHGACGLCSGLTIKQIEEGARNR